MTTLTPRGTPLSRFLSDGWVTTKRNLLKIKRVPDILVFTLIQPIMFVLLFTYVYGGVIEIPGSSYAEFLMAGNLRPNCGLWFHLLRLCDGTRSERRDYRQVSHPPDEPRSGLGGSNQRRHVY